MGMMIGFLLGSSSIRSSDDERNITPITTVRKKLDSFSQLLIRSNFTTFAELFALLFAIKFIYDVTDGKQFEAASNDENMKKALTTWSENLFSLDTTSLAVKELWYKVIRMLRSTTGHRPYKISVKEETIIHSDGSKSTKKEEKLISGTKLCKTIETFLEIMYPFIIASSAAVLGIRQLAQNIELRTLLAEGSKLPEIKTK
jgi:hypothetical protein